MELYKKIIAISLAGLILSAVFGMHAESDDNTEIAGTYPRQTQGPSNGQKATAAVAGFFTGCAWHLVCNYLVEGVGVIINTYCREDADFVDVASATYIVGTGTVIRAAMVGDLTLHVFNGIVSPHNTVPIINTKDPKEIEILMANAREENKEKRKQLLNIYTGGAGVGSGLFALLQKSRQAG